MLDAPREREFARPDAGGHVSLDDTGSGLYAPSQVERHAARLRSSVLGNPHSANPASRERQDVEIEVRDSIEVTGSRVAFEGQPAIIAAEIRKGDGTPTLRDASGFPAWSGWRRR